MTRTSSWETLAVWEGRVVDASIAAVGLTCPSQPRLHAALTHVVSAHTGRPGHLPRRVFALAVLGALGGDPEAALPICVVSSLWWAGAEALDDVVDGDAGTDDLSGPALLTAGIACLTVVPQTYLAVAPVPDRLRMTWMAHTSASSLAAAEGQLADMAREPSALTWRHVMATYVGKTGAAYERDAVMAAQLATDDEAVLRGWRTFGRLFGVLRQAHNDNSLADPADDEDLANGTPTLLLAHALDAVPVAERTRLLALRAAAMTDPALRPELRDALHAPDIVSGYRAKLGGLRRHAHTLLDHLTGPSDLGGVLRSWVDSSYALAIPGRDLAPAHR
jgi:heptaprenyl diphosphate synthase